MYMKKIQDIKQIFQPVKNEDIWLSEEDRIKWLRNNKKRYSASIRAMFNAWK
jgi:hypothetical protein